MLLCVCFGETVPSVGTVSPKQMHNNIMLLCICYQHFQNKSIPHNLDYLKNTKPLILQMNPFTSMSDRHLIHTVSLCGSAALKLQMFNKCATKVLDTLSNAILSHSYMKRISYILF